MSELVFNSKGTLFWLNHFAKTFFCLLLVKSFYVVKIYHLPESAQEHVMSCIGSYAKVGSLGRYFQMAVQVRVENAILPLVALKQGT